VLLENKNAVIYGAAGSVGSTVARAFAREGAKVYLTARDVGALEDLAKELGNADTAQVDASSEEDVERHLASIQGTIDVSFNAIGIPQRGIQGIPLTELSVGA
jgi:NAD(P)-dependent dehydrogenase (short-subunit alcohol dehydrogenase family)